MIVRNIKNGKPGMKKLIFGSQLATATLIGTLAVAIAGCATKPTYQNGSQSAPNIILNSEGVPNYHLVRRGDTVSQIAARYGLNYRHIGALNGLDSKYTIYTGQWLRLWQGQRGAPARNVPARSNVSTPPRYEAVTPPPTQQPYPPASAATPAPQAPATVTDNATLGYEYPTSNQVIRNFNSSAGTMGMWFAGREGDPVLASQAGTVLYAGDGLPEYGNLIMIRHSGDYITAYAHNSQLLVKEGEQVQRGQRIASMGRTGQTDQVALEFQVRLNGSPIDPRTVLGR